MFYSQNFEDVMLNRVFRGKNDGFYIDVGAHHPDELSVTKYFYEKGWSGINIEPNPQSFERMRSRRERDINLNVAIGDTNSELDFYCVEGTLPSGIDASALSSFDQKSIVESCDRFNLKHTKISIKTVRLDEICSKHSVNKISFLKIDVEGFEHSVLASANLTSHRPIVIVIEATPPNTNPLVDEYEKETFPELIKAGYDEVYFDGMNSFYLDNNYQELKKNFSIPISSFDGFSPYRNNILRTRMQNALASQKKQGAEIRRLSSQKESISSELKKISTHNEELKAQVVAKENSTIKLTKEVDALKRLLKDSEDQSACYEYQIAAVEEKKTELNEQVVKINAALCEQRRKISADRKLIKMLKNSNTKLKKANKQYCTKIDRLNTHFFEYQETLKQKSNEISVANETLLIIETALEKSEDRARQTEERCELILARLIDELDKNVLLNESNNRDQSLLKSLQNKVKNDESTISSLLKDKENLSDDNKKLNELVEAMRITLLARKMMIQCNL